MGADLYIEDLPRDAQYRGFEVSDEAVEVGYFRDCYNPSGLFWNLGLSWWETYNKFNLDKNDGKMKVEQIPVFKERVENAWNSLPEEFEQRDWDDSVIKMKKSDFKDWYELLIKFLELAEECESEIIFSV